MADATNRCRFRYLDNHVGGYKSREFNLAVNFSRHATVLCSWTVPVKIFISDLDINIKALCIKFTNVQFTKLG